MKRLGLLAGALAINVSAVCGQESAPAPRVEVGLNYSLLHSTVPHGNEQITGNGGSGYVVYNLNPLVGLVADLGAYRNGSTHGTFNGETTFTYLFGPRFSWRRWRRVTPYTQFLFGGARISASYISPTSTANDQNTFALAAGGGVDVTLTHHIAIKPIQVEYVMTQARNFAGDAENVQNHLRYSAGIVFRFGQK